MSNPVTVDLPHNLGVEEARRRIARNIGNLGSHVPGGADVQSNWTGNRLDLQVGTMGQQVAAQIDVEEKLVRLQVSLPPGLGFFSGMIRGLIERQGAQMLEDRTKG